MPYADPERQRAYNKAYKRMQRAHGLTKKSIDTRLTDLEIKSAEDLRGLFNEVVTTTRNADSSSLELKAKLRIMLRNVEIGLRVIGITNHEQRIAALEEQSK
jgi:uncharacterized coiled-coil protein SlyX